MVNYNIFFKKNSETMTLFFLVRSQSLIYLFNDLEQLRGNARLLKQHILKKFSIFFL